ncbi:unnamed protein product [Heterobilharzia americana]|nr:unnamed protein product [Heterobilharzia americana]CAH8459665.1 unnamed protein product [Heterobilharzia americana]
MSTRRKTNLLYGGKSYTHDLSSKPQNLCRNFYKLEGDPVGRGYAGKVYKIVASSLEPLKSKKTQFSTVVYSENVFVKPDEYLACKVIRRFRGGKDTTSRITSEIRAMINLQTYPLHSPSNNNYINNNPLDNSMQTSSKISPPKSASPRLFAVHEDPMEVAIIMEYAYGGSLYDLCTSAYGNDFARNTNRVLNIEQSTGDDSYLINSNICSSHAGDHHSRQFSSNGLPESYVCKLLGRILEALVYMHESLKMVHLDVKAENLLLRQPYPSIDVFLTDFGLATVLMEGKQHRELAGTPDYVAPEIINYDPITFATDMWSVGVLTYYLLTGISPFLGEDKLITMQNITHVEIEYPDSLFKSRSVNSIDFIQRLLQRSPKRRMSARECLSHPWIKLNQTNSDKENIDTHPKLKNDIISQPSTNACKPNYTLELFSTDPLVEMIEVLPLISAPCFALESPVHIIPYLSSVTKTNVVSILSGPLVKNQRSINKDNAISVKMQYSSSTLLSNRISNIISVLYSSSDNESFNRYTLNLSKKLINGHFSLHEFLSTITTKTRIGSINCGDYCFDYDYNLHIGYDDKSNESSRISSAYLSCIPLSVSLLTKHLSNPTTNFRINNVDDISLKSIHDVCTLNGLSILKYMKFFPPFCVINDLNYNSLLGHDCAIPISTVIKALDTDNTFNSSKNDISPKGDSETHMDFLIRKQQSIGDVSNKHQYETKAPMKISHYTTEILPRLDKIIPKVVNSHISTIRIEMKSMSRQQNMVINPSEYSYNYNYKRDKKPVYNVSLNICSPNQQTVMESCYSESRRVKHRQNLIFTYAQTFSIRLFFDLINFLRLFLRNLLNLLPSPYLLFRSKKRKYVPSSKL